MTGDEAARTNGTFRLFDTNVARVTGIRSLTPEQGRESVA